jgi:hypothetical protein
MSNNVVDLQMLGIINTISRIKVPNITSLLAHIRHTNERKLLDLRNDTNASQLRTAMMPTFGY